MKTNLVSVILKKVARRIGARVELDPEFGFAGQITYRSGVRRYFRASSLDLNPLGSSEIAKDKDYAKYFLKRMGYPVSDGKTFFSREWAETIGSERDVNSAYQYAKKLGFPVIVKPNSKSQGQGVTKVYTKKHFHRAMRYVFLKDRVALVERFAPGKDYRLVVLDRSVISAYQRTALFVRGDGRSSIAELLKRKQRMFKRVGRDTIIKMDDFRIEMKLRRLGYTMQSVLYRGEPQSLLDNANLSSGGDSVDVTDRVHPAFRALAVKITKEMGLRFCGVDLLVDGDISAPPGEYVVIEINSAPGLDNYAAIGPKQARIVEALYLKVLRAME